MILLITSFLEGFCNFVSTLTIELNKDKKTLTNIEESILTETELEYDIKNMMTLVKKNHFIKTADKLFVFPSLLAKCLKSEIIDMILKGDSDYNNIMYLFEVRDSLIHPKYDSDKLMNIDLDNNLTNNYIAPSHNIDYKKLFYSLTSIRNYILPICAFIDTALEDVNFANYSTFDFFLYSVQKECYVALGISEKMFAKIETPKSGLATKRTLEALQWLTGSANAEAVDAETADTNLT